MIPSFKCRQPKIGAAWLFNIELSALAVTGQFHVSSSATALTVQNSVLSDQTWKNFEHYPYFVQEDKIAVSMEQDFKFSQCNLSFVLL